MSELISGKDALIALANGKEVQGTMVGEWTDISIDQKLSIKSFTTGKNDVGDAVFFRLKPRTISINGIEVPAPFKPKDGEQAFYITAFGNYNALVFDWQLNNFGYWRTEEEIIQVVAALRQVLRGQKC